MRRPIPKSMTVNGGAMWQKTPWVIRDGSGNAVDAGNACGDYLENRTATCVDGDGAPVDEMYCRGQDKPALERQARHDAACTYGWRTNDWVDPGESCSLTETQTRTVTCLRDQDSAVMADSFCGSAKPDSTREVNDFSTCTYTWTPGAFVDPGANCTDAETQTRPVDCVRDLDGAKVADALCTADKPATTQTVRDISSCTYAWKTGEFVDPGASCTRSETQTRDVTCHRSLNDELADDASCNPAQRPTNTQTVADYESCSFSAVQWTEWTPSATCSASAMKTRTAKCQRSNDGGEIVDDAQCQASGVALTETIAEANYSSCGYEAVNWGNDQWSSTCSTNATITQTAQCRRSDGTIVDGGECTSRGVSLTRQITGQQNLSSCTYSAGADGWSDWNSHCSQTATRSRYVWCRRSDGVDVAASECNSRGMDLYAMYPPSETAEVYDQCGYTASNTQTSCSNGTQTVNWTCTRNQTGQQVAQSFCGTPAQSSQACSSYRWVTGGWGGFQGCQPNNLNSQYRDVYCEQNNGGNLSRVDDGFCGGGKPTNVNSQGCEYYSYYVGGGWGWSDWNSHCSNNAYREQGHSCIRNPDGYADNNYQSNQCTARGMQTWDREWAAVYDGCTYTASYGGWSQCSGGQQTRSMTQCTRSFDGASVAGEECVNRGQPWTQSQGCTVAPRCQIYYNTGSCTGNPSVSGQYSFEDAQGSIGQYHYIIANFYNEFTNNPASAPSNICIDGYTSGSGYQENDRTKIMGHPGGDISTAPSPYGAQQRATIVCK